MKIPTPPPAPPPTSFVGDTVTLLKNSQHLGNTYHSSSRNMAEWLDEVFVAAEFFVSTIQSITGWDTNGTMFYPR